MPSETLDRLQEYAIGTIEQIPRGEGRNFVGGRPAGRGVSHRMRTRCSPRRRSARTSQGPLADGMLGGTVIVCPLHERSYDLRTGEVLAGECDIAVYPVRSEADGTLILTL